MRRPGFISGLRFLLQACAILHTLCPVFFIYSLIAGLIAHFMIDNQ